MRKSMMLLALFLLPIASSSTEAASIMKGLYVGASVGAAMTNGFYDDGAGLNVDDSGTGWEALVGYQFAGPIAAEVSYVDLGKVSANGPAITNELKSHGVQFCAVATVPAASPLAAQARFGGFAWTQDFNFDRGGETFGSSENGTTICAGFGLRYRFQSLDHLGLTAKWTRYFDVGDSDYSGQSLDRDFFGAGVTWSFGSNEAAE